MNQQRTMIFLLLTAVSVLTSAAASADTYYVDSISGSDRRAGLSPESAWKSLSKVDTTSFSPGDSILLKSGQTFAGTLKPEGSGTPDNPIVVGKYVVHTRPVIEGRGKRASVHLINNEGGELPASN